MFISYGNKNTVHLLHKLYLLFYIQSLAAVGISIIFDILFAIVEIPAWSKYDEGNPVWQTLSGMHNFGIFCFVLILLLKLGLGFFLFKMTQKSGTQWIIYNLSHIVSSFCISYIYDFTNLLSLKYRFLHFVKLNKWIRFYLITKIKKSLTFLFKFNFKFALL